MSRFEKAKGGQFLIRAVSEIREDFKLLLTGDGSEKRCWLKYADELGIKNKIIPISSVNYVEISSFVNCMDVVVLPSLMTRYWKEQLSRALIEIMTCEVPVIGSDSDEIPNIIGNAGIIFREGDAEDLKRKLLLLMNSSTTSAKMVHTAKERISNIFSWAKIAQKTYKLYLETLALQDSHIKLM